MMMMMVLTSLILGIEPMGPQIGPRKDSNFKISQNADISSVSKLSCQRMLSNTVYRIKIDIVEK